MKNTLMHVSSRISPLLRQVLLFTAAASMTGGAINAVAQTAIDKSNTYTSLATGSDWTGGVVPGANNIAVWNESSVPGLEPLGANLTFAGIQILSPEGPVIISADGNTLTNGEVGIVGLNGIDMSSASQSLTLSNNVVINGVQNWKVASGQTLNIDGVLSRNEGGVVRMYLNPSTANIYTTNGTSVTSSTLSTASAVLGSTYGNNFFATINDTDYAAEASAPSGLQIVPGSTIGGLYTANPSGATPSDSSFYTSPGMTLCVVDNLASESPGIRIAGSPRYYGGFLFNTQQTNTTVVFNGLPSWEIWIPSGRACILNSVLITTNVGPSPVLVNNGAFSGGTIGNFSINNGGQQDLLIYQNNPAAPFIIQPTAQLTQVATGNLVKMGAGTMQIQSSSAYTGGTKIYEGSLEIDGNGTVDTGTLNVYGGTFAQSSGSTNIAPTTIFGGATNNILAVAANSQSGDTSTLTFNSGSTIQFLCSNTIVPSTTVPALVLSDNNGLTLNSPVNVAVLSGSISTGTFPLISYAGTIGGTGFSALSSLALPPHIFGYLSNDVTHSYIDLVVTNVDQPIAWNAGNGIWDIGVTANWLDPLGNTTTYQQVGPLGDNVLFNDNASGSSPITVTLNTNVTPSSVTVNNDNKTYIISGSGSIGGSGTVIKSDSGTVTLATINSFTGGMDINGGTVLFNTLPNLGASAINFGGGTLEYNGNTDDISTRTVNLNAGGGTINTAGSTVSYANPIGNNGAGGLTKTGLGTLTLNGTNTYAGNTTVNQGTLELGANSYLTNSTAIVVNSGAVLDTTVSGVNLWLSTHADQTLEGVGQVNGVVTAPTSTTITPAASGLTGTLNVNGGLTVAGGTLNMTFAATSNDVIAVTGNLTLTSGNMNVNVIGTLPVGTYTVITYSGSLTGSPGSIGLTGYNFANASESATLVAASGKIEMVVAVSAHDNIAWQGNGSTWDEAGTLDWLNGSTPWAYTNGDTVTFNDSASGNYSVSLEAALAPNTVTVSNTVVPTYTFVDGTGDGGGNIMGASASLVKDGTGTLIMETANSYGGPTTIKNGTLQIGSGGIGDIGKGNVTNNGALVFEEGDGASHPVPGSVSGTGSITENATATVELEANNTYTGPTTISAGTLQVGNGGTTGNLGNSSGVTDNGTLVLDEGGSFTFPYSVTGSGTLAVVGTGNVSLAGSSLEYQGNTYISNGIVKLAANNELPNENNVPGSTGDLNLDGGIASAGVLDLSGFNLTLNALSGQANNVNGIITNSSTSTTTTNVLTLLQTLATTYNGQIMDHGATGAKTELFVTGPGSLMLNPTTNYLTGVQNSSAFSGGMIISNGYVVLGAPGGEAAVNMNVSELAPGTGPITLLGTNTSLAVAGSAGFSTSPTYEPLTNTLIVPAGQTASLYGPCRGDINSTLLGSGVLNLQTVYVRGAVVGNWTAFSGQIVLSATNGGNGNLGIGTNGFPEAMVIFTTNVDMYCGALSPYPYAGSAGGAICPIGALAGGNFTCQIESTSSGNGGGEPTTWEIGGLNLSTVYNGGIVDSNSLLKVGTGTLTLNSGGILGTNTITNPDTGLPELVINYSTNDIIYTGPTTVSNGVLALDAPVVLTNSSTVTLASTTAELDASEMGYVSNLNITLDNGATQEVVIDSTFEVVGGQTLAGVGTLNGFLQADPGSIFNVGLPTGIFNVTSNALLAGAITMNLDTTDAPVCSELAAPSFTINSATLVVTNSGPGLFNDVTFTLFNHPVTFAPGSVTLPATDPTGTTNYLWENNLAVNGSITLTNGGLVVGPASPPHITFSLSGSSLTLSWPPPYLGYTLQAQTNSVRVGLSNNWVNVTGSPSGTNITITINPANGTVFYRLVQ